VVAWHHPGPPTVLHREAAPTTLGYGTRVPANILKCIKDIIANTGASLLTVTNRGPIGEARRKPSNPNFAWSYW